MARKTIDAKLASRKKRSAVRATLLQEAKKIERMAKIAIFKVEEDERYDAYTAMQNAVPLRYFAEEVVGILRNKADQIKIVDPCGSREDK